MDLLRTAAAVLALALVAGCAHGRRAEPERDAGHPPGDARTTSRPGDDAPAPEPEPRVISTDRAQADDANAGSPAREASQRVVEEGKGYLIAGRAREAAARFLTAIQIDPTNGFAYYHLGRARIALGDEDGAIGVLDKAETLLGPYPEWRARAAELADSLRDR